MSPRASVLISMFLAFLVFMVGHINTASVNRNVSTLKQVNK